MTRILLITILTFILYNSNAQDDSSPFLAKTIKKTSLKSGPDSSSKVKLILPVGTQLYVFSNNDQDGFIKVIDIKTNKLGYVRITSIKKIKDIPLSQSNSFEENGQSSGSEPEVVIKNRTSKTISLIVGSRYFSLPPHTTSTESIESGDLLYTASAPLVIPLSGRHYFKEGDKYSWTFIITTSYH